MIGPVFREGRIDRAGIWWVVAVLAVVALLDPSAAVGADEASFVERDGVLYVFNVPPAGFWAGGAGSANLHYGPPIDEMAERYQVPATLVAAVIRAESNFDPRAISPKGARGLMQLMPATAARLGVRDVFDPRENVQGGVRYLRDLITQYAGDVRLAVAAYNAGPEPVTRWRAVPPYPETQSYVARVMRLFESPQLVTAERVDPWQPREGAQVRQVASAVRSGPQRTARYVAPDGTIVYTNVPIESLPLTTRDRLAKPRTSGQAPVLASRQ
jgi:hypothetical protein